jgi:hypothetical protein
VVQDRRWVYKEGVDQIAEESVDAEGNAVLTVTAGLRSFLSFDGFQLTVHYEDGSTKSFEAASGRLDKDGILRNYDLER